MRIMDSVFDLLPTKITKRIVASGRMKFLSSSYGLYHNRGFSLSRLTNIFDDANMRIAWSKKLDDENQIAVTAIPVVTG